MTSGRLKIRYGALRPRLRNGARRLPIKPARLPDLEGAKPEVKTSAAKPSHEPCKTASRLPLVDGHHDLLAAAVELGSLEERIGYRFSDKLLGLTAFKASPFSCQLRFEGVTKSIESHHRLALLGDKVLYIILANSWYESGRPTSGYGSLEQMMVTRGALSHMACTMGLQRNFMYTGSISIPRLGEAFEALVGAIYVDSHYNLGKVQDFLTAIDFRATMHSYVEADFLSRPLSNEKPAEPKPLTSASTIVAPDPLPGCVKDAEGAVVPSQIQEYLERFAAFPYISSIYKVLATFKDVNNMASKAPLSKLVQALGKYTTHFADTADLCAWFPTIQARYLRLFGRETMFKAEWLRDRRKARGVKDALRPAERSPELFQPESFNMLVRSYWSAAAQAANTPLHSHRKGNLVMNLRRRKSLTSRDLFLTACRVEETARDKTREAAGLPDWYDLPEHRDKVLPPWRLLSDPASINDTLTKSDGTHSSKYGHSSTQSSVSVVREQPAEASDTAEHDAGLTRREAGTLGEQQLNVAVHSKARSLDAVIPMEVVWIEQSASQPPLLLDTAHRTRVELYQPEGRHVVSFSTTREQEPQLLPTLPSAVGPNETASGSIHSQDVLPLTQGHPPDLNDGSSRKEDASLRLRGSINPSNHEAPDPGIHL